LCPEVKRMFTNAWRQWLNRQIKVLGRGSRRGRRRCLDAYARRYRPRLDYLEDRCVPATITVTGTGDTIAVDGVVTLRQAITSANNNADVNRDVAAVGAYGADTIQFNIPGAGVQTITPASALPQVTDTVAIDGRNGGVPNNRVQISGGGTLNFGLD